MGWPRTAALLLFVLNHLPSTSSFFILPDAAPARIESPVEHHHHLTGNKNSGGPGGKECRGSASSLLAHAPTIPPPLLTLEADWFATASPCQALTPPPTLAGVWSAYATSVASWMGAHGGEYTAFLAQCQPWLLYADGECAAADTVTVMHTAPPPPPVSVTATKTVFTGGGGGQGAAPPTATVTVGPVGQGQEGGGPFAGVPGAGPRVVAGRGMVGAGVAFVLVGVLLL